MPEYQDRLVAFYDILGFSAYVNAHPSADDVDRVFRRVTSSASFLDELAEASGSRFTHFSDTIIRSTPFSGPNGPNRYGILFHELLEALHFQTDMIRQGLVLIRGAITWGQALHSQSEVYGPAVIRAYELETNVAFYPRIIIDPAVMASLEISEHLRSEHHSYQSEITHCRQLLRQGDDGIWFIDYLRASEGEFDDPELEYPMFLLRHRTMILRHLGTSQTLTRVSQKHLWLARYHNSHVDTLSDEALGENNLRRSDLYISHSDAPLYHTLE